MEHFQNVGSLDEMLQLKKTQFWDNNALNKGKLQWLEVYKLCRAAVPVKKMAACLHF